MQAAVMFSINFSHDRIFHFRSNAPFPKSHLFELAAQN
jgi:hypothetical protein